jgi:putative Holliday junction resolvase
MATDGYIVAVDYGEKRIGLAVAHSVARLPRPLCTLQNGPEIMADIQTATVETPLLRVVVGLPRNMDGSVGPQARRCVEFGQRLGEQLGVPVSFAEESLSSVEASSYMSDPGAKSAGLDAVAAACILERYFTEGESSTDGVA